MENKKSSFYTIYHYKITKSAYIMYDKQLFFCLPAENPLNYIKINAFIVKYRRVNFKN